MALLYSFQNREPAPLPERIRLEDGMTVRPPLSAEVLGELGYAGPIAVPSFDAETQVRVWDANDMVYRVQQLAPQELEARALKKQVAAANPRQGQTLIDLSFVKYVCPWRGCKALTPEP